MYRAAMSVVVIACLFALAMPAMAESLFFDFGDEPNHTPGNYNNLDWHQYPIADCVNDSGAYTGIGLTVYDAFYTTSANNNGTQSPTGDAAIFDPQATRDSLYGCTQPWYEQVQPTAGFRLTGLDPALTYDFTIFASRMGSSDNREAQYDITGMNAGSAVLESVGNTSNVVVISGISPTPTGEITVDVQPGPNNNNSYGFYYLGAMKMDVVPEPATLTLLLLGGVAVLRRR
ncbi:MAG: PEP-CTERM sorting domain-containing protein [Phycisphaerae bacterium]